MICETRSISRGVGARAVRSPLVRFSGVIRWRSSRSAVAWAYVRPRSNVYRPDDSGRAERRKVGERRLEISHNRR